MSPLILIVKQPGKESNNQEICEKQKKTLEKYCFSIPPGSKIFTYQPILTKFHMMVALGYREGPPARVRTPVARSIGYNV